MEPTHHQWLESLSHADRARVLEAQWKLIQAGWEQGQHEFYALACLNMAIQKAREAGIGPGGDPSRRPAAVPVDKVLAESSRKPGPRRRSRKA